MCLCVKNCPSGNGGFSYLFLCWRSYYARLLYVKKENRAFIYSVFLFVKNCPKRKLLCLNHSFA